MRRLKKIYAVALTLLIPLMVINSCSKSEGDKRVSKERKGREENKESTTTFSGRLDSVGVLLLRVGDIDLRKNNMKITIEFSGATVPQKIVSLKPKVSGKVVSVLVNEGDVVREGQLLAKISDTDYASAVRSLRAELEGLKAQLELAKINFERTRKLYEKNAVSQADFDAAKANYDNLSAKYESLKANLQRAEVDLGETRIVAPFSAIVVRKSVDIGAMVTPQTEMFVLQSREPYFYGKLAEEDAMVIKRAIERGKDRKIAVEFPSLGRVVQGFIYSIKPASGATGGFEIILKLSENIPPNISGVGKYNLNLGEYISELPSADRKVILLPYDSILISLDGEYIFSPSDGVATRHKVTILKKLSDYVLAELPAGVTSVVSPLTQRVYDGVKIKIIGERTLPSIIQ